MPGLLELLMASGANPMVAKDALGRSALHFAAAKGAEKTANSLLDLGLKPYQLDKQRNTPLHLAGKDGVRPVVASGTFWLASSYCCLFGKGRGSG